MSAEAAFQKHIYDILKGDASFVALTGGRLYDRVPDSPTYPYVVFGNHEVDEDGSNCVAAGDHSLFLDVWSGDVGAVEAKKINASIKSALHDNDADLEGGAMVYMEVPFRRTLLDRDGLTTHGIVRVEAHIEEA